MTQRSSWVQWRSEWQVRLKALLAKALFSKRDTFVTRTVKKYSVPIKWRSMTTRIYCIKAGVDKRLTLDLTLGFKVCR